MTKLYLGIPLIVLRKFVEMNKEYDDNFIQLFEINPMMVFDEKDIKEFTSNGAVVIDLEKLGGQNVK